LAVVREPGPPVEIGEDTHFTFRYAFVSSAGNGDRSSREERHESAVIVTDIEGFFQRVLAEADTEDTKIILEWWQVSVENVVPEQEEPKLTVCGKPEIESWSWSSNFHHGEEGDWKKYLVMITLPNSISSHQLDLIRGETHWV
jgi:hypothetical protein